MKRMIGWILLCLLLCGCEKTAEQPWTEPVFASAAEVWAVEAEETYADAPGELAELYGTLEELATAAEEIVRVAVLSIQEDNGFPVSDVRTAVSVLDAWKGDLRVGERIEILENGGAGSTVLGGIPRMALERTYVLFLRQDGEQYRICGAIQGRFIECGGYLFQQTWESLKLPDCTPMRTGAFRDLAAPEPFLCDGPPWEIDLCSMEKLRDFWAMKDLSEQEFGLTHPLWFSYKWEFLDLLDELNSLPVPAQMAAEMTVVNVQQERTDILLSVRKHMGEGRWWYQVLAEQTTPHEPLVYGRPVEGAEGFWECTDVLWENATYHRFYGQIDGFWISIGLDDRTRQEALNWLRETEFCTLGSMLE